MIICFIRSGDPAWTPASKGDATGLRTLVGDGPIEAFDSSAVARHVVGVDINATRLVHGVVERNAAAIAHIGPLSDPILAATGHAGGGSSEPELDAFGARQITGIFRTEPPGRCR
jgi:hypothetical protein